MDMAAISSLVDQDKKTKALMTTFEQYLNKDYELAKMQSDGFFDDTPSDRWKLRQNKVKDMHPNYFPDRRNGKSGFFYQAHYEPNFACSHERRIGRKGEGGKWVCDPHRISKPKNEKEGECLVYSVGSRNEFDFEEGVFKDINSTCEIHTFDPGNFTEAGKKAGVHYHMMAIGTEDRGKYRSLQSIVKELGHEGRTIDIFKIDCEGCEWATVKTWFNISATLRQIQIELHGVKTPETKDFFDTMEDNNYVITHKEPNIAFLMGFEPGMAKVTRWPSYAIEYAFLKLAPEFFKGVKDSETEANSTAS